MLVLGGVAMPLTVLPNLQQLLNALPLEGAVRIELEEGVPVFRASQLVQDRLSQLMAKMKEFGLSVEEELELDRYEEVDDYLSFVNRLVRNQFLIPSQQAS
jgi:hypothetical protein